MPGIAGTDVELKFNSPIFVKHFQAIADLAKDGTFKYGGRTSEAKPLFLSGECGIYMDSSGGLGDVTLQLSRALAALGRLEDALRDLDLVVKALKFALALNERSEFTLAP